MTQPGADQADGVLTGAQLADRVEAIATRADRQAFAELFHHFAPRLKSWLLRQRCPEHSAEELVQETLLQVWHRAGSYRRQRAAVSTWVFTIARNKRIDRLRRERRPAPDPNDPALVPNARGSDDYTWDVICGEERRLTSEIASLPPEQSRLLRMFYVEDKSHRVIADELEIPFGTVKSRLRLAMQRLRTAFRAA